MTKDARQDKTQETRQQTNKDKEQDTIKDRTQDLTVDTTVEPTIETIKETIKETTKDTIQDNVSDNILHIILLAAGNSSRFGANKLLHQINGTTMFEHTMDICLELLNEVEGDITVVTKYQEVQSLAVNAWGELPFLVCWNDKTELGISESIRVALNGVEECNRQSLINEENKTNVLDRVQKQHFYLFSVCDQPNLTANTLKSFVTSFFLSDKAIGCLAFGETLGNPVVFHQKYRNELMSLQGDVGGKKVVKRHLDEVYRHCVTDESELMDMDVNH